MVDRKSCQVGAVVQRVSVLGDALPLLVLALASRPDRENVRCLVQTLKCCGSVLEEEERGKPGGATPSMDRTVDALDRLAGEEGLEEGLAEMLRSLVRLRAAHWGHSPPGSAGGQLEAPGGLLPTFYGAEEEVMTMEEYRFMEEMGLGEEGEVGVQWSTGEAEPGMGDEAEAAFEAFLRQQS